MNKLVLRILVLVLAALQIVSSFLVNASSSSKLMNQASDATITPAGYAFTIWAVITIGSLAYGLYQLKVKRDRLYTAIAPYAALVFAGFSLWLFAANRNWLWLTVVIFIGMGICLYRVFGVILASRQQRTFSTLEQFITYGTFALYAGWTTVAIFANIASALKYTGLQDTGTSGIAWQAVILVCSTIVSALLLRRFKGSTAYVATILWAYVAVLVGTIQKRAEAGMLPVLTLLASGVIVAVYLFYKKRAPTNKLRSKA